MHFFLFDQKVLFGRPGDRLTGLFLKRPLGYQCKLYNNEKVLRWAFPPTSIFSKRAKISIELPWASKTFWTTLGNIFVTTNNNGLVRCEKQSLLCGTCGICLYKSKFEFIMQSRKFIKKGIYSGKSFYKRNSCSPLLPFISTTCI